VSVTGEAEVEFAYIDYLNSAAFTTITSPLDGVKLGVTSGVVDPPEAPELTKYDVMSVGAIYPGHLPHKATVTGVR